MRILNIIKDDRIAATSMLIEMNVREYLELVSEALNNLDIQRTPIKGFKPYDRLRQDLKEGCIVPPLVLGIKSGILEVPSSEDAPDFLEKLASVSRDSVYIIDGLQRTTAIMHVRGNLEHDEEDIFLKRLIRVEVWPDITLSALTYRMILLNAGQKPMSLKHQLEVVSQPLCEQLIKSIPGLQIYREKDMSRRSGAGQYQFSIIAAAFQAFVQKSPHIDVRNEVIAELNQIDVLADYGDSLEKSSTIDLTDSFVEYIQFLEEFDKKLCEKYNEKIDVDGTIIPTGVNILSRDTFHLGLAAAYGWCLNHKKDSLNLAKDKILLLLESSERDPLSIERLERIQTGFRRKDNTGEQTRNVIFSAFKEYFRSEGEQPFEKCWLQA